MPESMRALRVSSAALVFMSFLLIAFVRALLKR